MKLIDRLKNALFEEEYVEVDDKPKSKKKNKLLKKENPKKEEKPIAKKIVSTEKKEFIPSTREEEKELKDEYFEINPVADKEILTEKNDFKFPVMEEEDFRMEDSFVEEEIIEQNQEAKLYQASNKKDKEVIGAKEATGPYGLLEEDLPKYNDYETTHTEKTFFKPSPIISPIYGVLDKNYKKEEVISKREKRPSPNFSSNILDVDEVRKKAFGTLSDDIETVTQEVKEPPIEIEDDKDSLLLDLSERNDAPEVKKVTVADAEEYFEDLGLEYNVDYKDISKEKATGRRSSTREYHDTNEIEEAKHVKEEIPPYIQEMKESNDEDENDNLFDLIDSMYDGE